MTALSTYFSAMMQEKGVEYVELIWDNSRQNVEFNKSTISILFDATTSESSSPLANNNTETKRDRWNRMKQKTISDCTLNKPRRRISDLSGPQESTGDGMKERVTSDTLLSIPRRRISADKTEGDILLNRMISKRLSEEERIGGSLSGHNNNNNKWEVTEMQKGQSASRLVVSLNKFDGTVLERNSPFPPAS